MRNQSRIFWLLFFVHGVFGADEVSVMVGDSITLHTDVMETQAAEKLQWKIQGENKFIAIIDREISKTSVPGNDEGFSGRLDVNNTTGSLTITNLKTTDSRVYELQIKTSRETKSKIFKVTVNAVFGVEPNGEKSLSVMKDDSVTLHTGVEVQSADQIQWKFGDQVIIIARLNSAVDGRWSNTRLKEQTGDLTISNIRSDQTGDFKMEISTSSTILHRKFSINFRDGMKTVSVKKGEPVTLDTSLIEIKGYDLILWMSEGQVMAEMNRTTNTFSLFSAEGKFEGRLQREYQTGSLIIRDSRSTDSGVYHLNMSSSTYTLQRTINVTVTDVPVTDVPVADVPVAVLSHLEIVLIVVVLLVIISVMIIYKKIGWKRLCCKTDATAGEGNGLAKESDETEVL